MPREGFDHRRQSRDQQQAMLEAWAAERERGAFDQRRQAWARDHDLQTGARRPSASNSYQPPPRRRPVRDRQVGSWLRELGEDERADRRDEVARGPARTNSQLAGFAHACAAASNAADRSAWLVAESCLNMTGTPGEAASMIMGTRHIPARERRRALDLIAEIMAENQPCGICGRTGGDHALNCPLRLKKPK